MKSSLFQCVMIVFSHSLLFNVYFNFYSNAYLFVDQCYSKNCINCLEICLPFALCTQPGFRHCHILSPPLMSSKKRSAYQNNRGRQIIWKETGYPTQTETQTIFLQHEGRLFWRRKVFWKFRYCSNNLTPPNDVAFCVELDSRL